MTPSRVNNGMVESLYSNHRSPRSRDMENGDEPRHYREDRWSGMSLLFFGLCYREMFFSVGDKNPRSSSGIYQGWIEAKMVVYFEALTGFIYRFVLTSTNSSVKND